MYPHIHSTHIHSSNTTHTHSYTLTPALLPVRCFYQLHLIVWASYNGIDGFLIDASFAEILLADIEINTFLAPEGRNHGAYLEPAQEGAELTRDNGKEQ